MDAASDRLEKFMRVLAASAVCHEIWVTRATGKSLTALGPAHFDEASGKSSLAQSDVRIGLELGTGEPPRATISYGHTLTIQFVGAASTDPIDRKEPWSDIAALFLSLAKQQEGLLTPAERLVVEDFLSAVGLPSETGSAVQTGDRSSPPTPSTAPGRKTGGTITTVLSATIGALTAVLIDLASGGVDRTLFVLMVIALSGGLTWLTTWFTDRRWHNKWLAALAAGLATLTRWWPLPAGRLSASAVSCCVVGATAVGMLLVVPPSVHRINLGGSWHLRSFKIQDERGMNPSARWGDETWTLSRRQPCDGPLCAYEVSTSGGPNSYPYTFTLWPEDDHTLVGSAATWANCAETQPPYTVVTKWGYRQEEAFRVRLPQGDNSPDSASITEQVKYTSVERAEQKGCLPRTSADLASTVTRR